MENEGRKVTATLLRELLIEWDRWHEEHLRVRPDDWSTDRLDTLFQHLREGLRGPPKGR